MAGEERKPSAAPTGEAGSRGSRLPTSARARTARKMHTAGAFFRVLFPSFSTLTAISATTQALMPPRACWTRGESAKLLRNAAMRVMMMREGNTRPRVATTPPETPRYLCPTKVAVFTAMTPGVHWPMAK